MIGRPTGETGQTSGPASATQSSMPFAQRCREIDRLTAEIKAVQSQIAQLQARSVGLVSELDQHSGFIDLSLSGWVAWGAGLTTAEARRQVSLARRLPQLPRISEAFGTGALSEGVTATLVKVATPANEAALLDTAASATGAQLGRLVAEYRPLQPGRTADGRDPHEELFEGHVDDHGMYQGRVRLRPERGHQLEAAIRSVLEAADATPTPAEVAAAGGDDRDVARMTRPDALVALAQDHLVGRTTAPHVLPQRFLGIVRVDESALHGDLDDDARRAGDACLHATTSLDPASARRVLCDAGIAVLVERHGQPVTATAPQRFATAWQHTALWERDRGCRYPGCPRTVRLIAHHVIPHPVGPTHLDNLVLVCEHHHHKIHQQGWRGAWVDDADGTRRFAVFRPDDTRVHPPPAPRARPAETPTPARRLTGTGEPLTFYARDVIISHWHLADQRAVDDAAARDDPGPDHTHAA